MTHSPDMAQFATRESGASMCGGLYAAAVQPLPLPRRRRFTFLAGGAPWKNTVDLFMEDPALMLEEDEPTGWGAQVEARQNVAFR